MHKIKEKLMDELAEWEKKSGQLSNSDMDRIHKLTDVVKNIDKIEMLEEDSGYSAASDWMSDSKIYGMSYRGGDGYSNARMGRGRGSNANRDSMGRYSSRGGNSYRGGNYAYGDAAEHLMAKAEEMLDMADTPEQKKAIESFIRKIENV